ncbi:hypothetical protein [Gemmata sp.]|uniref:hypothetical protein n=1 Tax=Gemmata sp. TaxID=1914242 RepID=UPI003F730C61
MTTPSHRRRSARHRYAAAVAVVVAVGLGREAGDPTRADVPSTGSVAEQPDTRPAPGNVPVTLSIRTNRDRYDDDDAILVATEFRGPALTNIQLCTAGGSGLYFYLFVEGVGRKFPVVCKPVWHLQFVPVPERPTWESAQWLQALPTRHQFSIHLPWLRPPHGEYKMRIGYARQNAPKLEALAVKVFGEPVGVDAMGTGELKGSWDGVVISDPVHITIGPYVAPTPRPKP